MSDIKTNVIKQTNWIMERIRNGDIPDNVRERAKWILLDSIGCIISGMKGNKLPADEADRIMKSSAAMVSTELYEGNRFAIGHPASHIVPLMLEEVKTKEITYGDMITAFICAYEIAGRWGNAIRFSNDILGHGTVMVAGAAVVEGIFHKLSEEDLTNYMMICESIPEVSTWQSVFEGSALHDYYPGIAALNARNALYMNKDNLHSSEKMILSVYDNVIGANIVEDNLIKDLGSQWFITKNYFKVHAGCRFIHPFADLIEEMLQREELHPADIENIHIYTYKKAARLTSQAAENTLEAMFSIPVSIATLIVDRQLYDENISNAVGNNRIRELALRIFVAEDDKYNLLLPNIRGGRVEITKNNGETIVKEGYHAKGDFDNPEEFTKNDLINKFNLITKKYMKKEVQQKLTDSILNSADEMSAQDVLDSFYDLYR